jgi:hypothetical protein
MIAQVRCAAQGQMSQWGCGNLAQMRSLLPSPHVLENRKWRTTGPFMPFGHGRNIPLSGDVYVG